MDLICHMSCYMAVKYMLVPSKTSPLHQSLRCTHIQKSCVICVGIDVAFAY